MGEKVKDSTRHVEAVLRALDILDCFEGEPLLSLKKISELTGMNKSRIIRLCGTLEAKGYLVYDAEARRYRLGSRILSLSKIYERSHNLVSLARPVLRYLADHTGESASLFVVEGLKRLCLVREEGTFSVRYNILEGQRMVLYAGAGGKVLLAFGPEELRRRVLGKNRLRELTSRTIKDPRDLEKELGVIRRQGYAVSYGERDADAAALAAPIYNHEEKVCAALTIAGPTHRFSPEHNVKHLKILLASAERLSRVLGYQGKIHQAQKHQ
jgi:DNA-binding IclR family transcriptional regulator